MNLNGETLNEFSKKDKEEERQYRLPFGGGSGAGVSINPVAFLIVQEGYAKLLPVSYSSAIDKLIDYVPDLVEKVNQMLQNKLKQQSEQIERTNKIIEENSKRAKTERKQEKTTMQETAEPKLRHEPKKHLQPERKERTSEKFYEYEYDENNEPQNDVIDVDDYE